MRFRGCYRVVRRSDHAVPSSPQVMAARAGSLLDIRIWARTGGPYLLVNAARRNGGAVLRNRFRRRVRMAFLRLLREAPGAALAQGVVWVRPARGLRLGPAKPSFQDIFRQLTQALRGPGRP